MVSDFFNKISLFFKTYVGLLLNNKDPKVEYLSMSAVITYYHKERMYKCLLKHIPFNTTEEDITSALEDSVRRHEDSLPNDTMPNRALYSDTINVDEFNMFLGPFCDFHAFLKDDDLFPFKVCSANWPLFIDFNKEGFEKKKILIIDSSMKKINTYPLDRWMFERWNTSIKLD